MCGRYAMGIRASFIRYRLQQRGQQVDDAADDDDLRETYNFAPGYYGAVLRADTPDTGGRNPEDEGEMPQQDDAELTSEQAETNANADTTDEHLEETRDKNKTKYKLQSMKWGLIPFWTKRSPDYGSLMRTINCRDDSLIENRGMWTSMKRRKRCIVICQGFYEWLKKGSSGKDRVPYFVKRKDDDLMCFAGLWDCVQYEGSDEKLYTYTVITTSPNAQLKFLHDRMPVILEPGSDAMTAWLDPKRTAWTKELQSLLKPYEGELEIYPVSKDVGKVGNNSPDFIVPLNSNKNKKNIANFFGPKSPKGPKKEIAFDTVKEVKDELEEAEESKPQTAVESFTSFNSAGVKREHSPEGEFDREEKASKTIKTELLASSPTKKAGGRQIRSATTNGSVPGKPSYKNKAAKGTPRITSFFTK